MFVRRVGGQETSFETVTITDCQTLEPTTVFTVPRRALRCEQGQQPTDICLKHSTAVVTAGQKCNHSHPATLAVLSELRDSFRRIPSARPAWCLLTPLAIRPELRSTQTHKHLNVLARGAFTLWISKPTKQTPYERSLPLPR
jgi:hypothetical protein